jgi:hypothetical protein
MCSVVSSWYLRDVARHFANVVLMSLCRSRNNYRSYSRLTLVYQPFSCPTECGFFAFRFVACVSFKKNLSPVFKVGLRKGIIAHQTLFQRFQSQFLIWIYLSVGFPTKTNQVQKAVGTLQSSSGQDKIRQRAYHLFYLL